MRNVEWTPSQYNEKYKNWGENMYKRYENYKTMWSIILKLIDKNEKIADFGCGAGLFASYAIEKGHNYSFGVDFSDKAIQFAEKLNPFHKNKFFIGNLYKKWVYNYNDYDVALFLDVLEHLDDDFFPLSCIPSNKKLILALPNFWSPDHVRVFQGKESLNRYNDLINIEKIDKWKNIWIVKGTRK